MPRRAWPTTVYWLIEDLLRDLDDEGDLGKWLRTLLEAVEKRNFYLAALAAGRADTARYRMRERLRQQREAARFEEPIQGSTSHDRDTR